MRRPLIAIFLLLTSSMPVWAETISSTQPVGASVEELLNLARRMNPELAASAAETDAAKARAEGADAFPDPKLQITLDEISKNNAGLPGRAAVYKYTLQQEIPGWGKREAKREIAEAESREVAGQQEDRTAEILMKIKTAYADYHRVHLTMDQTNDLIQVMRALVEFARFRYAQGMGLQLEATSAEAERGALSSELVRLEKERHRIRARLNALVNRPPDAPLVEHPHMRPMPSDAALNYETLLERVLAANPGMHMTQARLEAAQGESQLVAKDWLPDMEVGFGLVNRRNEEMRDGFEAMINVNLPLQIEWRKAREHEASAKKQAAHERLASVRLQLEAGLREAILSLEEARQVEQTSRDLLLPQARIAMQSSLKGYETGSAEAVTVLDAVQRVKKFQIDLVKAQFEQQVRLAEIERLIGGEL
ncbi:MAG: TolC family protein [Magnetococcales bacterium]|nr:TolC family protein [Magnetococcales bacterium]MBF0439368.1 TolC family protein [Magnetococcales bacterium]